MSVSLISRTAGLSPVHLCSRNGLVMITSSTLSMGIIDAVMFLVSISRQSTIDQVQHRWVLGTSYKNTAAEIGTVL